MSTRVSATSVMIFLAAGAAAAPQHGGERALLLVDPTNPDALHVANHYAALRDVPGANVVYLDPDAADYASLAAAQLRTMRGEVLQRGIEASVDFVVLAPSDSFFVAASGLLDDPCSPVHRLALPSAYGLFDYEALLLGPGTPSVQQPNTYSRTTWLAEGFRSELRWLGGLPSAAVNARRYYVPCSLGWLGTLGNSKAEVLAMLDRSVAVDATFPGGTAYYMQTTDPARSAPRHAIFPTAVSQMALAGGLAEHLMDVLPLARTDVLGVMTGWADPAIDTGNFTLLPGSFCDHLTSYAATFDVASQVKMSRWIAKGASGTAGTVEEPCNYASKFPHARLHVVYRRGMTLGEAWFRSMSGAPFQALFLGDPLTSPWCLAPSVTVSGLPQGAASGVVSFDATATPHALGGTAIVEYELFVDGVRRARTAPPGTFALDTATLADGWHDVRVRATDDAAGRNAGVWRGALQVANLGRTVTCVPSQVQGDLTQRFDLDLATTGGDVDEVVVRQGGRVVAALVGGAGTVELHGRNLGAGPVVLVAEATYSDGGRARSAEVALDVLDNETVLVGSVPVAYGYRRVLATQDPYVLDLPASFEAGLGAVSHTLLDAPAQSTVLGSAGPVRLCAPAPGARGVDLARFEVTAAGGVSQRAVVQVVYAAGQADARLVCDPSPNAFEPAARLGWSGSGSLAADDLALAFAGLPPQSFGLVFQGEGVTRVPAGNGRLCVGANLARLGVVQADAAGRAAFAVDTTNPPSPAAAVQAGDTRVFQLWYRDVGGAGYNFSDALVLTFTP